MKTREPGTPGTWRNSPVMGYMKLTPGRKPVGVSFFAFYCQSVVSIRRDRYNISCKKEAVYVRDR